MLERLKKKIPIERIWQTVNLNLRISSGRRANYLKKHHIFKNMGEHVSLQMRKIPLYPKLISFGNNIMVASNVSFLTHDAIHHVFNGLLEGQGESRRVNEKVGCIDIRDNCFIGATPASPNQFLRFLVFRHSLFCFRRTATAQLFRLLYCKEHGFSLNGKRS